MRSILHALGRGSPESWLHDATCPLIGAKNGSIDKLLLNLDDASAFGEQTDPDEFWRMKEEFIDAKK